MTMQTYPVFTEGRHTGEYILSEANHMRSRDNIVVAAGSGKLEAGTVLGKIVAGAASTAAVAGNTGNGTIALAAPALGVGAKPGTYRAVFDEKATNAGDFSVYDPEGNFIGTGAVGTAFTGPINFTIADGATDFAANDAFAINVAAGSDKYAPANLAAIDGSNVASAILYMNVDATTQDVSVAATVRDSEVVGARLTYHASVNSPALIAAKIVELAKQGIIVR